MGITRLRSPNGRTHWQMIAFVYAFLAFGYHRAVAFDTPSSPPQAPSAAVSVAVRDGLLSVEAKAAAWAEVLNEVRQKTGILFHCSLPLEGSVTVSFANLPAEQALRYLFGPDASFLFLYSAVDARSAASSLPSKVWVVGKKPGQMFETPSEKTRLASSMIGNEGEILDEIGKEFDRNPQAAREAALGSFNPEIRRRAILHFGWQADQEALSVLREVTRDPDPEIQRNAVDALELLVDQPAMRRSTVEALGRLVGAHPRVEEVLTHVMNTAEQADIRQLAADSLGVPPKPALDEAASTDTTEAAGR